MIWLPAKDAVRRVWNRRWVRRISYALVAGTTAYLVVPWVATSPAAIRWAVGRLDALSREETGLPLTIGQVEFHPTHGALVLHDITMGGDLLTIHRLEVQADVWSLLGPNPRIHAVRVDQPHLYLTEAGVSALRLKPHTPRQGPLPALRLDRITLTGGEIQVPEPLRGLPPLRYQFEVKGYGLGANHLRVELTGPHLTIRGPHGWEKGRLDLNGEVSEPSIHLHEAYLRLGDSQARLNGRYESATTKAASRVEGRLSGVLDLAQLAHWSHLRQAPLEGNLDMAGTLGGTLAQPVWTFTADGQELQPAQATFQAGDFGLKASGGLDHAKASDIRWSSPQGDVHAQAEWAHHGPIQLQLQGTNLDLASLGRLLRVQELDGVQGQIDAQLTVPVPEHDLLRPDRWRGAAKGGFLQRGQDAGRWAATLEQGRLSLEDLDLHLEALKLAGTGQATVGPRGLLGVDAEGRAEVQGLRVARTLKAWLGQTLDMDGAAQAQAKLHWRPDSGLELDGTTQVAHPRWHGATADSLQASVAIRGEELRVQDIQIAKDQGRGSGDLWLTWGDTAPGQNQIDMCFTATGLPVAEGLRAADLKDGDGLDYPISGSVDGWARISGPFAHLAMTGIAQVKSGEVYGIKVPAGSSAFSMDLDALRLTLSDLRIAERSDRLGGAGASPEGALALTGHADMDFNHWTWWVDLGGRVDSQMLALPGPRIQAQTQIRLLGPITSPFGSLDLPNGQVVLSHGRIFFGNRSVEGLEGKATLADGHLTGRLGMEGMGTPLIEAKINQEGPDLVGHLALTISPESAHTEPVARSLTEDLLEDGSIRATAEGRWKNGRDLSWSGSLDRLSARFSAFELHQDQPSLLRGNDSSATVNLSLDGGARRATDPALAKAAHIRVEGAVPFSGTSPMAIQAQGTADLAHLKAILDRFMEVDEFSLLSELQIQGTSHFNLLAHGTYADPLLDGTLALEKGQMHLRGYQGVEDLQAEAVLKDRVVTLSEANPLRGTLAHGQLQASGSMNWRIGGLDTYAFKASLSGFQLRDLPDGLDLQGNLKATFEGNEAGGLIKGKLKADRLSYQNEVKLSDLILRSALNESGSVVGLDLEDPLDSIRLDLDLDLLTPWSFDTNLLKLEGRTEGPFQVVGTLGHPVPKGTLVFQPGGRITNIFPAGDMVVDRGSLEFSDIRALDPRITLQGSVTSIPGYTVNLDVRGTLSNLAIIPSSTPSLRQDEIVSILINPSNVANVGTAAASQGATQGAITSGLASAGFGLLSTLAFSPVQDQLRRALGLDRVNVALRTTSLGTTETEFTLGKSINLFGQRSAIVGSHKRSGELSITSGQVEWRFGDFILQIGVSKGGSSGLNPSGEIRHTWSPK
jgi:hypothetical protein